jgi:hypothetical protein
MFDLSLENYPKTTARMKAILNEMSLLLGGRVIPLRRGSFCLDEEMVREWIESYDPYTQTFREKRVEGQFRL